MPFPVGAGEASLPTKLLECVSYVVELDSPVIRISGLSLMRKNDCNRYIGAPY